MPTIRILSDNDVLSLKPSTADVLAAVELGLVDQAANDASAEPTVSFQPIGSEGLVSIIRGSSGRSDRSLVKTVGTFPANAAHSLPTNPGSLMLLDSETGLPLAILGASMITTMRTAAVTAIGARALAPAGAGTLGCIGTRGIALQAVRYIAEIMPLTQIRLHSSNTERVTSVACDLEQDLGISVTASTDWRSCLAGMDIMIEGASLKEPQPLFPSDVLEPGTTLIAYGMHSSMQTYLWSRVDRLIMDRWVPGDTGEYGAFGPLVASGDVTEERVDAMIGDVLSGQSTGRETPDQAVVFWHRGVAACDIALANMLLEAAESRSLGQEIEI